MLNVEAYALLREAPSTLKETSRSGNLKAPMTESIMPVVDFDLVKDNYVKELSANGLSISETPTSSDAFYIHCNGEMYLIEFKSGVMEEGKNHNVRRKMLDSLLLLTDIIDKKISHTRKELNYILVYDKNTQKDSFAEIAKSVSRDGNKEFVRFGLQRFETIYFKRVFTVTRERFEKQFVNAWTAS